ncbi:MAG: ATP F0F1 synthase subunit B [Pseudomonadota bacterium]
MSIFYDSNVVALIALLLFFGILIYAKVPKMLAGLLDARADRIRSELEEARRLREEAQETLATFERKRQEVAGQAEDIVAHAKAEAEQAAEKAKADLAASIERRLKAADEQITMAEARAVKEVKDRAVQVAVAAASEVVAKAMSPEKADELISSSIAEVGRRLN